MPTMRELEAQAKALAPIMAQLVRQAEDGLRKEFADQIQERDQRIADLEKSLADAKVDEASIVEKLNQAIPKPKDGADADMEALRAHLDGLVKAIPAPKDGDSVTIDDVAPFIREELAKAVSEIPAPKDGESVTPEDVRPMLADMVEQAVKALPAAQPGKDADMDALKSHLGELVKGVEPAPAPSVDEIAAAFERRFSDLTLSWERQARDTFEKAADRMPTPKNGQDALPLESFDLALCEDGRTVTVKMQAGEAVIEKSVRIAAVIDRGIFGKDKTFQQGDGVTFGGCYWIAQKDAPEGVPGGSDDWRLAVKKGRDGKDLRDNASQRNPSDPVKIRGDK